MNFIPIPLKVRVSKCCIYCVSLLDASWIVVVRGAEGKEIGSIGEQQMRKNKSHFPG